MQDRDIAGSTPRVVRTEVLSEHGAAVIVDGDLDLDTAPQLHDAIATQIRNGHRHFVIDLSDATFLDSTAMGTLLRAISPLRGNPDTAVVLAGVKGMVERALMVSGIGQMFTQFDTRHAGVEAVEGATEPLRDTWRHVRLRGES